MMKKILLILIVLVAIVARFYRLDEHPALNADEAAIGYNAFSLISTGKDEHGNPWPIHFQSFNDYKPGLYVYLTIPFVKLMGLNEWAVRIPGALTGVLTVLLIYFLVLELVKDERVAMVSSLFLAMSPWHIHFSRGGWEVNTATFLIVLGVVMLFRAIKKPGIFSFLVSVLPFIAALYTYHAARVTIPLIGAGILLFFRKEILNKKNFKSVVIGIVVGIVLLLPLIKDLTGEAGISRAAGVGLFADQGPFNRVNEQRGEHKDFTSFATKILHNKPVNYSLAFLANWAEHFHGEFLFLSGDEIQRNRVPETGQMHMIDALFVVFGILFLFKNRNKGSWFIIYWLAVSPVAAALTFQSPHALRAQSMVIPLVIISAIGFSSILKKIGQLGKFKRLTTWLLYFVMVLSFGRYLHMYYVHMAKEYPFSSQYGFKELTSFIKSGVADNYKNVMITDRYDQPYILTLFYLNYDPSKFQKNHILTPKDQFGFSTVRSFDKYIFTSITNWDETRNEYKDSLIAGTDKEIFEGTNVVKRIYGENGYLYFEIVAN